MESEKWVRVRKARKFEKMEIGSSSNINTNNYNYYASSSLMPPPSSLVDLTSSSRMSMVNPNLNASHENEMSMKNKVIGHPLFSRLMSSYINCQMVGAPSEVVARLEHAAAAAAAAAASMSLVVRRELEEVDPELDQFMEAYCEMLTKYHEELRKPFHEAMTGLSKINSQLNALTSASPSTYNASSSTTDLGRQSGSSEETYVNENCVDPRSENKDSDIRAQLLQKYRGCLGSLSQELKKKKKNGKLPKEARVQLQEWWSRNYTWPYPSEAQKMALAASTGLVAKQINNWFINQRKRHWKPSSERMQLAKVDHPQFFYNYMDHVIWNPSSMDCASALD